MVVHAVDNLDANGESQKFNKYACACSIVASMISIIFGYDTGVMSGAMIFIKEELKIDDVEVEVLAGILNICALVGSLFAGRTSDYIGRRYTIVLASVIFMVGAVLMGYGPDYAVLLGGRCISGIGVGFALMIAPVYSAEISIGILLGYISNYFFAKLTLKLGWRLMLGVAAIPSLVLAFGIIKMPESPRWLAMQGRLGDAKKVLLLVCNSTEEADRRLHDIKIAAGFDPNCNEDYLKPSKHSRGKGVWKELFLRPTPAVRRILVAAIGIHFFEHATGIEAIVLYGPRIFKKAGIKSKEKLLLATIGVGLTKTLFITFSTFLLDKVGRRKLLLVSTAGMVVMLSTVGFGLTLAEASKHESKWALVLSIVATYTFLAFFSIGLAPVTWVYSAEIFPLKLRAQGVAIGVAVNRLMNATISMTFISLYKAITIGGAFFLFAGIAVIAWFFFYFLCPETKGKSLEEMELLFSRRSRNSNGGIEIQPGSNASNANK
ncbi:putative polyol transporter 6 [Citrus sinensis]|nr:putative polyol transporter 6 [Citrus sinensis]